MPVVERRLIHRGWPGHQYWHTLGAAEGERAHVYDRVEIAQTITGKLAKDTYHEDLSHSPSTIVIVEQRSV